MTNINANLQDIQAALEALDLCCPDITIIAKEFADEPEPQPASPSEEPPPGWEMPDEQIGTPVYEERRCDRAGQVLDGLIEVLSQFDTYSVPLLSGLSFHVLAAIATAILSSPAVGPFGIVLGIAGAIPSLVVLLIVGGWDAGAMAATITAEREDLLCAIFEASNASAAKTAMLALLDPLMNVVELQIVDFLLSRSGAINNVYFFRSDVPPPSVGSDCSMCANPECANRLGYGQLVSDNGSTIVGNSLFQASKHRFGVYLYSEVTKEPCEKTYSVTITITGGSVSQSGSVKIFRLWSPAAYPVPSGGAGDLYNDNPVPPQTAGVWAVSITSGVAFSCQIDYVEDV